MIPMTIAHLSDLHLSAEHKRNHIRRTRQALEYVRHLNADHVVITGDVTADGHPADYRVARSVFAAAGLLDTARLTVTIGNHDVFGGVNTAEDVLSFPGRCAQTDEKARLKAFGQAFAETFQRTLTTSDKRLFPFAKVIGDVALIALNTVAPYSRMKNPLGSNGSVEDKSFELLRELLESPFLRAKRKIVALHHHFHKMGESQSGAVHSVWGAIERQTMKLRGKSRLIKLFSQNNVEMVLHGHIHQSMEYYRDGVRFVNAGGSILHDNNPDLHISVIRVGPSGSAVEIHRIPFAGVQRRIPESVHVEPELLSAGHEAA
jgi:3',5'-cyclic AMP phosphodiesterase CpdA